MEIFRSGDMLKSTRCFAHDVWGLARDATWQDVLERAVELTGSYIDIGLNDPVEWNMWWELSAR